MFVQDATDDLTVRTDTEGEKFEVEATLGIGAATPDAALEAPELTSLGMYYEATDTALPDDTTTGGVDESTHSETNGLDYGDVVTVGPTTKSHQVYSYRDLGDDNAVGGTGTAADSTRYVIVEMVNSQTGGNTHTTYQHVDVTALAAPDTSRDLGTTTTPGSHEQVQVTASIPMAIKYDHIHFGVWAGLDEASKTDGSNKTDTQKLTGLGIGWVQSIGDGMTDRLGIGTVTFNGDWVAVVQRQNSTGAGVFNIRDGDASMTANFEKDEFEADLVGLAMLEGTLDGNGFSGMTATQISHADLDSDGDFEGSFSGNIYGPRGSEAAGVFDFDGGDAGSFRGAFGGTNQE